MQVCPKCGFNGRNEDQCERCGIIFDKMHTILEVRPLGQIPLPPRIMLGGPRPDPQSAPTQDAPKASLPGQAAPPRVAAALARSEPVAAQPIRAHDRHATDVDVPLVPRVPADRPRSSRFFPLVGTLVCVAALWGAFAWRQARQADARDAAVVENTTDFAYFDMSVESLLTDAKHNLRSITDAAAAQTELEGMTARIRHLQQSLGAAPIAADERVQYAAALDALTSFLEHDVKAVIASASEVGARTEPVPTWALTRAASALARARDTHAAHTTGEASQPAPQ